MAARKPKKLPVYLKVEEADALLAYAKSRVDTARTAKQRRRALRDWLAIHLDLLTGLRVAELCALQVHHIDLNARMLQVVQGKGAKDRTIPLHEDLVAPLKEWIGDRTIGYLFESPLGPGRKLSTRTWQAIVPRLATEAGIVGKRVTPHKFRHSFATRLVERGVDIVAVRDLMGHGSISTTQTYLHACPERLRSAIEAL